MTKSLRNASRKSEPIQAEKFATLMKPANKVQVVVNGVVFEVTPELDAAVRRACEAAAMPLPDEMTTTAAAEFLDVSRPFVVKLVKQRKLPCRLVGTHRRIPTAALRQYKEAMFQAARAASDEMTKEGQELGLYDLAGRIKEGV